MIWIWVGIAITLSLVEYLSKKMIALCFVASAIVSAILTFFIGNYIIQLVQFLAVGIILAVAVSPKIVKFVESYKNKKN